MGLMSGPSFFPEAQMGKKLYVGNLSYDTTDATHPGWEWSADTGSPDRCGRRWQ